jgi:hypothetical protein
MTSSPHGPYGLGYTRATMAVTVGSELREEELIPKSRLSSDCSLQLESMKLESLVIVDQHATVNTFPGLVHTARHTMGVGLPEGGALTARRQPTTVGSATGVKS